MVSAKEQVSESLASEQSEPAPTPVLLAVVLEMAPLAQRHQIARAVVRGVVIPVSRREHHARGPELLLEALDLEHTTNPPPLPVSPGLTLWIPPAAVAQVTDHAPMWAAAALALSLGALEADHDGELLPVDGIEPAVLRTDRH
jgi:hypothetical protein